MRYAHIVEEAKLASNRTEPASLIVKTAAQSRVDINYNLSTDKSLRHIYKDAKGNINYSKFLEDLDALAGNVAFFFCDDGLPETSACSLVTACVEQIEIFRKISIHEDIVLSGQVVWVGKSSLDVLVEAHQFPVGNAHETPQLLEAAGSGTRVLSSVFTYVARDRTTGKATTINPLSTVGMTAAEKRFYDERAAAAAARKGAEAESVFDIATLSARKMALENALSRGKALQNLPCLAGPGVLMSSTALENTFICQPQKCNTAGKVFGGYLIHEACNLAQASMYMFSGRPAQLLFIPKIVFRRPVLIGDMIKLSARVVYASREQPRRAMCEITCQIVKPEQASSLLSNHFSFVFALEGDMSLQVLPGSREEGEALVSGATRVLRIRPEDLAEEYES